MGDFVIIDVGIVLSSDSVYFGNHVNMIEAKMAKWLNVNE